MWWQPKEKDCKEGGWLFSFAQGKRIWDVGTLVIAILSMRMIMDPAKPVVEEVGCDNEYHRRNEQPGLIMNEENLKNQ
jgi:hypothetical protein